MARRIGFVIWVLAVVSGVVVLFLSRANAPGESPITPTSSNLQVSPSPLSKPTPLATALPSPTASQGGSSRDLEDQGLVSCPSEQTAVLVDSLSLVAGATGDLDVVLCHASSGLSGFLLAIAVDDASVAEIVGAKTGFRLSSASQLPAAALTLEAVDLNDIVPVRSQRSQLARLSVLGKRSGTTVVRVVIRAMDDDYGGPIMPTTLSGVLEVRP